MTTSNEISFGRAFDALRQWYYNEVSEWAEGFDARIQKKEWADEESFRESFEQETDGAECIIYTAQAKAVLLASDNEDAYQEEFGEPSPTVEAAALMAFQRDILERMVEDPQTIGTDDEEEE